MGNIYTYTFIFSHGSFSIVVLVYQKPLETLSSTCNPTVKSVTYGISVFELNTESFSKRGEKVW